MADLHWKFAAVVVIGVLVFIHELGHFLVAKWCGVGVVKFSIGFGPAIWRKRINDTIYQLSIIPLGGFVRMVGDMPDPITGPQETDKAVREHVRIEEEICERLMKDRNTWFIEKPLWARSAIVFAGPLFNFISALVFIFIAYAYYGQAVPVTAAIIGDVRPGSPAEAGGLKVKDRVLSIGETQINSWTELAKRTSHGPDVPTLVKVERGGQPLELTITPRKGSISLGSSTTEETYLIGVKPDVEYRPISLSQSFIGACEWLGTFTLKSYEDIWGMIRGQVSAKAIAGPILIFDTASEQAKKGFENTLYFMAILSVSLAVLNLLPIPVLDGGHLLFFLCEAILGPLSIRKKEIAQQVGFVFLLCLMCFALSNDILREKTPVPGDVVWQDKPAKK